jgi:hypothetical protein
MPQGAQLVSPQGVGRWIRVLVAAGVAAAAVALVLTARGAVAAPAADPVVARGEYLMTIAGCNDCHTPLKMGAHGPEPDTSRLFSGHPAEMTLPAPPQLPPGPWVATITGTLTAFAGPWGISYARNLTPDPETGLGRWTEEQFVRALRTGKHLGVADGRMILPPMPWMHIGRATDEDLHAIWSYLRTVPPIVNAAPQSVPAPPPAQ